jgi:hypothetical protein
MQRLLLLALVTSSACSAKTKEAVPPRDTDSHGEIDRLASEIDTALANGKVEPLNVKPLHLDDQSCKPAATDACTQSCTLSDSVCENADKICKLADKLPGDTWASQKCQSATDSCKHTHEACCSCV